MKMNKSMMLFLLTAVILMFTGCSANNTNENSTFRNQTLSNNEINQNNSKVSEEPAANTDSSAVISNSNSEISTTSSNLSTASSPDASGRNLAQKNTSSVINAFSTDTGKDQKSSDKKTEVHKKVVVIDAGHQLNGNYDVEPIGPGSKTKKPKVSSGTQGVVTGVAEYELNLAVAKKVEKELEGRGYKVVMIRETNKVNLSNKERADIANKSGADIFIRIHADSSTDHNVSGTSTLYPSKRNPYVPKLSAPSYALSKAIVNQISDETGSKNRGAIARDDMSGINWCKIPVTIIEMGFMSNKNEDKLMETIDYQNKIVKGICDGIDEYFKNQK